MEKETSRLLFIMFIIFSVGVIAVFRMGTHKILMCFDWPRFGCFFFQNTQH